MGDVLKEILDKKEASNIYIITINEHKYVTATKLLSDFSFSSTESLRPNNLKLFNLQLKHLRTNTFDDDFFLDLDELKIENNLIFSYSSSNANTSDLHTVFCNQQEFYSSVSVSPVFLPLK